MSVKSTSVIVNFRKPGSAFVNPHKVVGHRRPATRQVPYLAFCGGSSCIVALTIANSIAVTYASFRDFRLKRNSLYVVPESIVPCVVKHGTDTWRFRCKPGPTESIRCCLNTVKLTPHRLSIRKKICTIAPSSELMRGVPVYLGLIDASNPDVDLDLLEKLRKTSTKRLVIILHLNGVVPADYYGDTIFTIPCPNVGAKHPKPTYESMVILCSLLKTARPVSRLKSPLSSETGERYLQLPSDFYLFN